MVENNQKKHYILITSLDVLLRHKTLKHKSSRTCEDCFQRFTTNNMFVRHIESCQSESGQVYEMPDDKILTFKKFSFRFPNVLTAYTGILFILKYFERRNNFQWVK